MPTNDLANVIARWREEVGPSPRPPGGYWEIIIAPDDLFVLLDAAEGKIRVQEIAMEYAKRIVALEGALYELLHHINTYDGGKGLEDAINAAACVLDGESE